MQKKSLLLIDGDKLKIVYDEKMRCISFQDLSLEHNVEFLEKIFRTTTVFKVDQVSAVALEQLEGLLTSEDTTVTQQTTSEIGTVSKESQVRKIVPKHNPVTQQTTSVDQSSNWIKSNSKTTMIIDDLYTGNTINRGRASVPQSLALPPGKPFDLNSIKEDLVKASRILPRLLSQGFVSRISFDEAMGMLSQYEKSQGQILNAHDAPPRKLKPSEMVDSMFDDDAEDDADSDSAISIEISGQDVGGSGSSNEDSGSMGNLMEILSSAEESGELQGKGSAKYTGIIKKANQI